MKAPDSPYKPLEPRDLKGSFEGDVRPSKASAVLYWHFFWALSSYMPLEPGEGKPSHPGLLRTILGCCFEELKSNYDNIWIYST